MSKNWTIRDFIKKYQNQFEWWRSETPFQVRVIGTEQWTTIDKFVQWFGGVTVPCKGSDLPSNYRILRGLPLEKLEFRLKPEPKWRDFTESEIITEVMEAKVLVASKEVNGLTGIPKYVGLLFWSNGFFYLPGYGPSFDKNYLCGYFVNHSTGKEFKKLDEST